MSARRHYDSEEEDDDEVDFIPGAEDDDEDEFDDDDFDDDDDSPGKIPQFLQGEMIFNDSNPGTIVYKQDGSFCLKSQEKLPKFWSLQSPALPGKIKFGGWISNPTEWLDFDVDLSEQDVVDPLDEKMLKAQQEGLSISEKDTNEANPSNANMKSPPTYSLKAPPSYSLKQPPSTDLKKKAPSVNSSNPAFTISGSQKVSSKDQECIQFRGVFYPPDQRLQKFFLICSVTVHEQANQNTTATAAASSAVATAAVASSRKRDRSDDEESNSDGEVHCQELIDLHEDAGMSTEELRKKYYMESDRKEMVLATKKRSNA